MAENEGKPTGRRLYFFWDYDIDEDQVRAILRGDNEDEKIWVISRIVQHARWDDIWRYLSLTDVTRYLSRIQWRNAEMKEAWEHALQVWNERAA